MASNGGIVVNPAGATLSPLYKENNQEVVAVPVVEIKDASSSASEEVVQFSAGTFLFSGAFWLGFERIITEGYKDPLFIACTAFVICGAILAIVGFRQALRRVRRLERYLPEDDKST